MLCRLQRSCYGALSLLLLCAALAACMGPTADLPRRQIAVTTELPTHPVPPPPKAPGYPQLGGIAPGSLLEVEPFSLIDPRYTISSGASAWRIRYMSVSAVDDAPVEVTAAVLIPGGSPPSGGWDVIAYNHGNTGISENCGPSLYDDMNNQWQPISVLLMGGYAVVAADYEGLGGAGSHAFLNAAALGRNVIDAVRATRHMRPDISDRWAAFGGSLGGLATWAANEQASTHGGDLTLVGAASWVPVVDASDLPAKAAAGRLTEDQTHLYFLAIMGLKRTTHPDLDLERFMRGSLYENRELLLVCNGPEVNDALRVLETADPADLKPIDRAAQDDMTAWLKELAVPQQRMAAPMLVVYGTEDLLVDQSWIERAIIGACALGDTVDWLARPGEGHGDINAAMAFPWLQARFDNQEPVNRCLTDPLQP